MIKSPCGINLDSSGNVYFGDYSAFHVIRKITTSTGVISTVAGTGSTSGGYNGDNIQATAATLNNPYDVVLDNIGNMYISDSSNFRVRKVSISSGLIDTVAGNGTKASTADGSAATSATLNLPRYSRVDDSGNLYISEFYGDIIRKVITVSTDSPTLSPTMVPTILPTKPTVTPTTEPSSVLPTVMPSTEVPSEVPTIVPTTSLPSELPSTLPTYIPTLAPNTEVPSKVPTILPTSSVPTLTPTFSPTFVPTFTPTYTPTSIPTVLTGTPSVIPTSYVPSLIPTEVPSVKPTCLPTNIPSVVPTPIPTVIPTMTPSFSPTVTPILAPTFVPTFIPTFLPTSIPSSIPTLTPSNAPSFKPTMEPTNLPSLRPTLIPTMTPSRFPSLDPTIAPSKVPTIEPTYNPTYIPGTPTIEPTEFPSIYPTTFAPSHEPSQLPTTSPSLDLPVISYFTVIQRMQEVTASEWRSCTECDSIFKQTISIVTGIDESNIAVISLSDVSISSAFKRSTIIKNVNVHRALSTTELAINYTVTYSGDSKDVYSNFKNDLDFSLTTGSFDIYLHTYAEQYGCSELNNVTSSTTASYTEPIVLNSDDSNSDNGSNYSTAIGATLGIFAICSCGFYFFYHRYSKLKKEKMEEDPNVVNKDNFRPSDLGFELTSKLGIDAYDMSKSNSLSPNSSLNILLSPNNDDPSVARLKLREKNNRMSLNRPSFVVNPILEEKNEFDIPPGLPSSTETLNISTIQSPSEIPLRKVNRPTGTPVETAATTQAVRKVNRPTGVIANIQVKNALLASGTTNTETKPQFARRVTSTLRNSIVQNSIAQQSDMAPVSFGSQNNSPSQSPVFIERKSMSMIPPPPPPPLKPPIYDVQSKALAALSEDDEFDATVVTNKEENTEVKKRIVNRRYL